MTFVFFIIFISMFAVAVLALLAFFPIRVSWFYHRDKAPPKSLRSAAPRDKLHNPYKNYNKIDDDDIYDDPEL